MSSALIHHHFKDKETLWQLVGERIANDFLQAVTAAINPELHGSSECVKQMFAAYLAYWRQHPRALRFKLWRELDAQTDERQAGQSLIYQ